MSDPNYFFLLFFQDAIRECMEQIEVSITLSMSGMSFQPNNNNAAQHSAVPKVIKTQQKQQEFTGAYPPASTTPTDVMDVSKACVYWKLYNYWSLNTL